MTTASIDTTTAARSLHSYDRTDDGTWLEGPLTGVVAEFECGWQWDAAVAEQCGIRVLAHERQDDYQRERGTQLIVAQVRATGAILVSYQPY